MVQEKMMYYCPRCFAVFRAEQGNIPVCGGCRISTKELGYSETQWYEKSKQERDFLLGQGGGTLTATQTAAIEAAANVPIDSKKLKRQRHTPFIPLYALAFVLVCRFISSFIQFELKLGVGRLSDVPIVGRVLEIIWVITFAAFYFGIFILPVVWIIVGIVGLTGIKKRDDKTRHVPKNVELFLFIAYLIVGIVAFLCIAINVDMLLII